MTGGFILIRRTRRGVHSRKAKLMRKIRGKGWIVATTALALGVAVPTTILATSPQAIQAVLTSAKSSTFTDKDTIIDNETIQAESSKALDGVSLKWTMNDLDTVKAEINRQKELGLEVYVVQWGDTLSILAQATNQTVSDLAALNGVED